MQILTGDEMREADRRAIHEVGIPGRVLMESAGRAVAGAMEAHIDTLEQCSVVIICGKGNNGGDGLVLLRTLTGLGYEARAVVLAPLEELAADTLHNLQSSLKLGHQVDWVQSESDWDKLRGRWESADVVVDAIFGTGLNADVHGVALQAIDDLNLVPAFKVAVDVPSGLRSDSGSVSGAVLTADLTVALAAPKLCHFISPACEACGVVEVVDIGIPPDVIEEGVPRAETIEPEFLSLQWPARPPSSHKGTFGHLLIVAGSRGKTGAAVMAARAALRSGAGLVTVASAASAIPLMAAQVPEAMWEPLSETTEGTIDETAGSRLHELAADRSALAIGPGLGTDAATLRVVTDLVENAPTATVVDADALRGLPVSRSSAPRLPLAITPHPGEAARLLGLTAAEVQAERLHAARELSSTLDVLVVLKGFRTLICDAVGNTSVNLTGNAGLATAGTGDVLTGIIGGLLAQGAEVRAALELGVYVHGLAGDLAASELGQTALTATDVIGKLPAAIQTLSVP